MPILIQNGVGSTRVLPMNYRIANPAITSSCVVTGAVTYTVEYTMDDITASDFDPATARWSAIGGAQSNASTTSTLNLTVPVTGIRLRVSGGTGSVVATINQYGNL